MTSYQEKLYEKRQKYKIKLRSLKLRKFLRKFLVLETVYTVDFCAVAHFDRK